MPAFICTTCGTQYPEADQPPPGCAICQEERQYVNLLGQSWTTLTALRRTHFNAFRRHEPGLTGIGLPAGPAVSAVLTYRPATYWLPVVPGWAAWRLRQRRGYV